MNKISKWFFEVDMIQKSKWIFWFFIGGTVYHLYHVYDLSNNDNWSMFSAAWGLGIFATSALYHSVIIYWMKENKRRMTQITNLIMENHELKHEIMIRDMPNIAKINKCDSLD